MNAPTNTIELVKAYYGKVLATSKDLKTNACCSAEAMPAAVRPLLDDIHPEVQEKFYGCGAPFPPALEGLTVLDLGSGSGRDAYLLSRLVGERGKVIGVDMTDAQLAVARAHLDWHRARYGHARSNVEFRQGYIEDLAGAGLESGSVDLVVSNCVLNLSPDKPRVFSEIFRVLKPGGELYFSDVYADRRLPEAVRHDPLLLGECLGGALYTQDLRRLLLDLGCRDYRVLSDRQLLLGSAELEAKVGPARFFSTTIRAFKLDLEDRCEDYGQVAWYLGTVSGHPHQLVLDDHHTFPTGKGVPVCRNTALMLQRTRFGAHFKVDGAATVHFGLFDCAPAPAASASQAACC